MGFYFAQVKRYFDLLGRDRLRVFLYEDFKSNPLAMAKEVFQILGIDGPFVPYSSKKYNVGDLPRNHALHIVLLQTASARGKITRRLPPPRWRVNQRVEALTEWNRLTPPPLSHDTRARLLSEYREGILRLQNWLQ
jgi:hypothetical protein